MIEINLLPEDLRIKVRTKNTEAAVVKTAAVLKQDLFFIYAIPAILGIFVVLHLYFAVAVMLKNGKLISLNKKWLEMEPQKKVFDEFNKEFSAASADAGMAQGLISKRVGWTQKLNKLSLNLPSGVWFNEISTNSKGITIQGSVISLEKEEIHLINKFMDNLKADTGFSKDFSGFELSNVQKRQIEGYEVADFVLTGVLKSK
ncbi:MAG: PilN domain-containing protein [Candidatus Omnitrophota bacterium]